MVLPWVHSNGTLMWAQSVLLRGICITLYRSVKKGRCEDKGTDGSICQGLCSDAVIYCKVRKRICIPILWKIYQWYYLVKWGQSHTWKRILMLWNRRVKESIIRQYFVTEMQTLIKWWYSHIWDCDLESWCSSVVCCFSWYRFEMVFSRLIKRRRGAVIRLRYNAMA